MKIQASLKVMPAGENQTASYDKVNEAIALIDSSGLKYQVGPSETTIEGEYQEIFQLIEKIHEYLIASDIRQIAMFIMTDYNQEGTYIDGKLNNVNQYLGGRNNED